MMPGAGVGGWGVGGWMPQGKPGGPPELLTLNQDL